MEQNKRIIEYFRNKYCSISKITIEVDPSSTFRRLLYISLMDALSKVIYPVRNKNRERFTTFIKEFADWEDCTRISMTHLQRYLSLNPEPEFEKIRQYVRAEITKWVPGEIITIDREPKIETIRSKWLKDNKWLEIRLESFQHLQLLYELRNNLVHEFKTLGNTAFNDFEKKPYYIHTTTLISLNPEKTTETWDLYYPLSFLAELEGNLIDNLEKYLNANEFDYSYYLSDGSYWIEEIN